MPPVQGAQGNVSKSISRSIAQQQSNLLRTGKPGPQRYSTIRQRHLWSTYTFCTGGAISLTSPYTQIPTITPNIYPVFKSPVGQQGQGLPSGLQMTDLDTNFAGQGRVPDQQNFSVWEIGVTLGPQRTDVVLASPSNRGAGPLDADDVDRILTDGVLRVKYLTEEVSLGALHEFMQPGGPHMSAPTLLDYTARGLGILANGVFGGQSEGNPAVQPFSAPVARTQANSGNLAPAPALRRKLEVPIFLGATTQFEFQLAFPRPVPLRTLRNGGTQGFTARVDLWVVESYRPHS